MARTPCFLFFLLCAAAASANDPGGDWRYYGADARSTRFADLDEIHKDNFEQVRVVWRWRMPDERIRNASPGLDYDKNRTTPLAVDGVLYTSTPFNLVAALDAATGAPLWVFDPQVWTERTFFLGNHRGLAYGEQGGRRRLYFGTADGQLFCLDAASGRPDSSFGQGGRVNLAATLRRPPSGRGYGVTGPPLVVGGVVIVGSAIGDHRYRPPPEYTTPGDVQAFDARSGKHLWSFHTIPQQGEYGNESWKSDAWQRYGSANVWAAMSADPELGYVYLAVSTPSHDFYGGERPGDNLFGDSIVCLEAKTGRRVWHFQLIHHGLWDYDPPAAPILLDIRAKGRKIRAVAQLSKQAFCYVFDRETGEPVWPIEERPVPPSAAAGEQASPTQPFPTRPPAFDRQGLRQEDLIDFSEELRQEALDIVSDLDYGPLYTPPSERGAILVPGLIGGADWAGGAADPRRGVVYVPSHTLPALVRLRAVRDPRAHSAYAAQVFDPLEGPRGLPLTRPPYGRITAIDLNKGEHLWQRAVGRGPVDHPALRALELPDLGWDVRTFVLATPTLLLAASQNPRQEEGRSPRYFYVDPEAWLRAYDPQTGEPVGQAALPGNAYGNPMSYRAGGRQYVVVPIGDRSRPPELVALALPRPGERLPPQGLERGDAEHEDFYRAVAALDRGDGRELSRLLRKDPALARARGFMEEHYEYGRLRGATLLHLSTGNPLRARLSGEALDLARVLLEAGADANAATLDSSSVLDLAVGSEQLGWYGIRNEYIGLLLKNGANPGLQRSRILWTALVGGHLEVARLLVEQGTPVDLRLAAGVGSTELMRTFFRPDGSLTERAGSLYRPVSSPRAPDAAQVLAEALAFAVLAGEREAAALLVDRGADLNAYAEGFWGADDPGSTALHKAVSARDAEMVRFLLDRGADPHLADRRFQSTPLGWAEYFGYEGIAVLLRPYGEGDVAAEE